MSGRLWAKALSGGARAALRVPFPLFYSMVVVATPALCGLLPRAPAQAPEVGRPRAQL